MEKNPNFELSLGLWLLQFCLLSVVDTGTAAGGVVSLSLGIDVQKALLHPVTIAAANYSESFSFVFLKGNRMKEMKLNSFTKELDVIAIV